MILRRVEAIWPHADDMDMLCFGYGHSILETYCKDTRRSINAAPAAQGAVRWPATEDSRTTLVDEDRLPFADALFDRILVIHGMEDADNPERLLRELWRVAAPEARILLVAANRSGAWAHSENTPFGHGRPYSRTQLNRLLENALFQPVASSKALYVPPLSWKFITSAAQSWEKTGEIGWNALGGVLMVEAVKRLYIDPKQPKAHKVKLKQQAPSGAAHVKPRAPTFSPKSEKTSK
jgi:SAM-dependent methyltransferase